MALWAIFFMIQNIYFNWNLGITAQYNYTDSIPCWIFLCFFIILMLQSFEIQVLSMSAIKCQGDLRIFQFALSTCWPKNCRKLNKSLCKISFGVATTLCRGLWFGFLTVVATCSIKFHSLRIAHLNGWNGRQYFFCW